MDSPRSVIPEKLESPFESRVSQCRRICKKPPGTGPGRIVPARLEYSVVVSSGAPHRPHSAAPRLPDVPGLRVARAGRMARSAMVMRVEMTRAVKVVVSRNVVEVTAVRHIIAGVVIIVAGVVPDRMSTSAIVAATLVTEVSA